MTTHTIRPHSIEHTEHCRQKGVRFDRIVNAHRRADGTVDHAALIASAVAARKAVQALELIVNRGDVDFTLRERLTALQQIDIDHRQVLDLQVPAWTETLAATREEFPRCQLAKVMIRTGRAMGLWLPLEKGSR